MRKLFLVALAIYYSKTGYVATKNIKIIVIEYNALRKVCKLTLDIESIRYRPI